MALVVDGSSLRLYRNGTEVASGQVRGFSRQDPVPGLGIGCWTNRTGTDVYAKDPCYWQGRIDELAIFNEALSAEQVRQLYTGPANTAGSSIGEVRSQQKRSRRKALADEGGRRRTCELSVDLGRFHRSANRNRVREKEAGPAVRNRTAKGRVCFFSVRCYEELRRIEMNGFAVFAAALVRSLSQDWTKRIEMKSFAAFAVAVVVSLVCMTGTTQASTVNVITNGDFETGPTDLHDSPGWTLSPGPIEFYGTSHGYGNPGGVYLLKYASATNGPGFLTQSIGTLSAGMEYDVSYQAQGDGTDASQVFAQLSYNSSGVWTPLAPSPNTFDVPADNNMPWLTNTFSFTTVAGGSPLHRPGSAV